MANTYTYTHQRGEAMESPFASGKVVCDGSTDLYIELGFLPSKIRILVDDATATADWTARWFAGMTEGAYERITHAGGTTILSIQTSGGPTPYAGRAADPGSSLDEILPGIYIPAALFANTDVCYWEAER